MESAKFFQHFLCFRGKTQIVFRLWRLDYLRIIKLEIHTEFRILNFDNLKEIDTVRNPKKIKLLNIILKLLIWDKKYTVLCKFKAPGSRG